MANLSPNIPIITLNVNDLNIPIESQRLAKWIKEHDPTICCLQGIPFKYNVKDRLIVKG